MFKVNEISKLLGLDRSFLHYYDEIGIIVPVKNEKNYRYYNENDLIAIASSKYYRAMDMPLSSLSQVILESDYDKKVEIMQHQKAMMLYEAERMKDLAIVADYAISTYEMAYQNEILFNQQSEAFEFLPLIHQGKVNSTLVNDEATKKLLDFFPFVSYAYYFPKNALIDEESFTYYLGLSAIHSFREKYKLDLPQGCFLGKSSPCLVLSLTKDISINSFCYADFEEIRQVAIRDNISLTGEAIAYCVFTNYEHEHSSIKFVVQIITN